ncbi:LysR family transcriptional regulator [Paraglaciecola aquimarina]|uniref:LysR family transcriptional regulator n=1 Tax=Paraglaciecola aquimarina TaxID=1235557 RepID=A0ABU3SWA0_9ALTE|nr:LysR family transcriptional regulator [Paraglaciecola aquimarina]MDU0354281.1 LysR family transcriptional regulator [Paraglaciecola aquimarina]
MNVEHLSLFVRVAMTHNISAAGQELGLSPAVASAHISKLEDALNVRLIHRTTRKVSLTEEGEAFLPHAEEVLAQVDAARASVGKGNASPSGKLRVAAPISFGRSHLVPALKDFLARYPDLKVDFRLSDSMVDMVEGGFDISIRNAALKDSTLVARKLAADKRIVCAAPSYLKEFGTPKVPTDLLEHECLRLIGLEVWNFNGKEGPQSIKTNGAFRTDSGEVVRDAAVEGIGITISSTWNCYQQIANGQLVQILADYTIEPETAIWAVYPSSRLLAPKVRAFIDYFSERFSGVPYWDAKSKPRILAHNVALISVGKK